MDLVEIKTLKVGEKIKKSDDRLLTGLCIFFQVEEITENMNK